VGGRNGDALFSRGVAPKVSSELKSLTSVFGMGTGVPSSLLPPVHLHIQAVSLDMSYIIIVGIACQYFFYEFLHYMREEVSQLSISRYWSLLKLHR
jgi:hypothetical protein